jgi:hypothetical protein
MLRTTGLIYLALQEERFAEEGSKSLLIIYQQQQRHQQQQEQSFDAQDVSPGTVHPKMFGNAHPPHRSEIPLLIRQSSTHAHTHMYVHTADRL